MRKVLITGGAGFIGSEVVRQAVKKGYKVVVMDSLTYAGDMERLKDVVQSIAFYHGDIKDTSFVEEVFSRERPEAVIHMAAETHVDRSIISPSPFLDTNVKGTMVLLQVSLKYRVEKFINMSTDEVYGELGKEGSFTEESPLNPNSPYSVSKAAADMLGRAFFRTYGLPVITVRACNHYGPWQYPEKFIPVIILRAYLNEKIPVYGRGENVREWLHVSDGARAILRLVEKGKPGEVYNVGSGQELKNIEVAETVLRIMNKPLSLITFVKDRPGHDFRYSLDWGKIERELNWRPEIKLKKGLKQTVEWYLNNIEWVMRKRKELEKLWERVYSWSGGKK